MLQRHLALNCDVPVVADGGLEALVEGGDRERRGQLCWSTSSPDCRPWMSGYIAETALTSMKGWKGGLPPGKMLSSRSHARRELAKLRRAITVLLCDLEYATPTRGCQTCDVFTYPSSCRFGANECWCKGPLSQAVPAVAGVAPTTPCCHRRSREAGAARNHHAVVRDCLCPA